MHAAFEYDFAGEVFQVFFGIFDCNYLLTDVDLGCGESASVVIDHGVIHEGDELFHVGVCYLGVGYGFCFLAKGWVAAIYDFKDGFFEEIIFLVVYRFIFCRFSHGGIIRYFCKLR